MTDQPTHIPVKKPAQITLSVRTAATVAFIVLILLVKRIDLTVNINHYHIMK